jgi:uncharacterized phage infection (PIP) family protein YhgE
LLVKKIEESNHTTDEMLAQIARLQNDCERRRVGFAQKLKCKREELHSRQLSAIENIQSLTSISLVETEKLTAQIGNFTQEIQDAAHPKEAYVPDFGPIDFSEKTARELRRRQEAMDKKCAEEFSPLFQQLEERHRHAIEALQQKQKKELEQIELECSREIEAFAPRTFISRQEIKLRQTYEVTEERDKQQYEKKRDELNEQIRAIETERDEEMQRITDEVDQHIFEGEQRVRNRIQKFRESVVEPELPEIPHRFDLTPEQENEMRQKIELSLKESFEMKVKTAVSTVAQQRESMQREVTLATEQHLDAAHRQFEEEIAGTRVQIADLQEQLRSGVDAVHCLKAEWAESNHSRKDKEDLLSKLQNGSARLQARLDELNDALGQLNRDPGNEEDDREADAIQGELDTLGKAVLREKRWHVHHITKSVAAHDDSIAQIKERVRALSERKDELIARLKAEIRATKAKAKALEQELRTRIAEYGKA